MGRTLTIKKGGNNQFTKGWHTLAISGAKYGKFEDSSYIDVWFENFPDHFKMRLYAKKNKEGEEFAIGQLFRFANAGITEALEGDGNNVVVKIDDEAIELVGKDVNVYFYKDAKGYTSVLQQVAPTVFTNVVEEFNEDDVEYWKTKAEAYYENYVLPKIETTSSNGVVTEEAIPF